MTQRIINVEAESFFGDRDCVHGKKLTADCIDCETACSPLLSIYDLLKRIRSGLSFISHIEVRLADDCFNEPSLYIRSHFDMPGRRDLYFELKLYRSEMQQFCGPTKETELFIDHYMNAVIRRFKKDFGVDVSRREKNPKRLP